LRNEFSLGGASSGGERVVLQKILDFVVVEALPNRLYRLGSDR
jgi:hypothetical protein